MKKLFVVLFAAVMMSFSLVACGGKKDPAGTEQTVSIGSPEEVINQIYAKKTVNLRLMTTVMDLSDSDAVKYNLGLDDASKVKEAAVSEPMMGSQAYSLVAVKVNDAKDTKDVANAMLNGINQRKWICVEADNLKVMAKNDTILLFMVDRSFADTVKVDEIEAAFTGICGGSLDLNLSK